VISRIFGAAVRALLVSSLVVLPALMLGPNGSDGAQISVLVALLAAVFVFAEYSSSYPSFVEFRHAPPFNRMRFVMLMLMVICLTWLTRHAGHPGVLTGIVSRGASAMGELLDLPYSPVRIFIYGLPTDSSLELIERARDGAAMVYAMSLTALGTFALLVHVYDWPSRNGAFNVWVNLPLFDPTTGGDVLPRLRRDGWLNIAAGVVLPFVIPAGIRLASGVFDAFTLFDSQSFVWTMVAWAFIPASMIMRGIAMGRVADLIEEKRRRAYARAQHAG